MYISGSILAMMDSHQWAISHKVRIQTLNLPQRTAAQCSQEKNMYVYNCWLVVWLPFFICPSIGCLIIPIDVHIFQRGGPTTNQIVYRLQMINSRLAFPRSQWSGVTKVAGGAGVVNSGSSQAASATAAINTGGFCCYRGNVFAKDMCALAGESFDTSGGETIVVCSFWWDHDMNSFICASFGEYWVEESGSIVMEGSPKLMVYNPIYKGKDGQHMGEILGKDLGTNMGIRYW